MSPNNHSSSTQEALADAAAGVAGSLVAMLSFYPIDVLKTNLQASSSSTTTNTYNNNTSIIKTIHKWKKQILTIAFIKSIFRGLHYKAAHTVTSSFTYFFIYSFIKSQHRKQYMLFSKNNVYNPSTTSRLVLSALAGMVNVTLTFPLDVLAARSQTKKNDSSAVLEDDCNDYDGDQRQQRNYTRAKTKINESTAKKNKDRHQHEQKVMNNSNLQKVMDQVWNNIQMKNDNHMMNNNSENDEWEGYDTADDDLSFDDVNQIKMECKVGELNQDYDHFDHINGGKHNVDEDDDNDDGLSYSDHYANNDYDDDHHDDHDQEKETNTTMIGKDDNDAYDHNHHSISSGETTVDQTLACSTSTTNPIQQQPQKQQQILNNETTLTETDLTHVYRYPSLYQPIPSQMIERTLSLINKSSSSPKDDDNNNNNNTTITTKTYNQQQKLLSSSSSKSYKFFQLWSGIKPALLLCSNPAINFTVFDIVKEHLIVYKQTRHTTTQSQKQQQNHDSIRISMMEAFLIGLIAKFAATIATYPLIRAKVMLMVADKNKRNQRQNKKSQIRRNHNDDDNDDNDEAMTTEDEDPSISMVSILYNICAKEGIQGLYKGCGLQLIHTMLKSALLMMVRERINVTTRKLIISK